MWNISHRFVILSTGLPYRSEGGGRGCRTFLKVLDLSGLSGRSTCLQATEPNPAMSSHYDGLCPLKPWSRTNSSKESEHRGQRCHWSGGSIDEFYFQVRRYASPLSSQSGQWVSVQNSLFVFVLFHVLRLGSLQHMNNSLWKTFWRFRVS